MTRARERIVKAWMTLFMASVVWSVCYPMRYTLFSDALNVVRLLLLCAGAGLSLCIRYGGEE